MLSLKVGISAMKTIFSGNREYANENCPMCNENFRKLGEGSPFSHHEHTKLICKISGEVMDDQNMPLLLPSGRAYSAKALEQMAEKKGGKVTCMETNREYDLLQLKKVFIT